MTTTDITPAPEQPAPEQQPPAPPPAPAPEQQPPAPPPAPASPPRERKLLRAFLTIALGIALFVGGVFYERSQYVDSPGLDYFADAWFLLHEAYVDPDGLDPTTLAHGAIKGMADAVGDTGHTYFLTPDEAAIDEGSMTGLLGGIGVEFDDPDDPFRISAVDPEMPATIVGVAVGDRVIAVDGVATDGPDGLDILDRIVGLPGEAVVLSIERAGSVEPLDFKITRKLLDFDDVSWAMVPGTSIGLVLLTQFADEVGAEMATAVRSAVDAGATRLILDLRGNPGGRLDQAVAVAGEFLSPGTTVLQERDREGTETDHVVPSDARPVDLALVVLVDRDSFSAAEVIAAVLQETGRAKVVGRPTAGTGTILDEWEFDDGAVFSIGTSRWLTPNGASVWHIGVMPDIEVALPIDVLPMWPEDIDSERSIDDWGDTQLQQAIDLLK
jgi:carboxyl-terminal processing protease